jgi:peptidoglycan LD-endopeptidase CwlK
MPSFGTAAQLATCHPRLQLVLREAIKYFDFAVIEGHRGQKAQDAAFAKGLSKLKWPNGNHNSKPSRAADIAPFPVDWREGEKPHLRFAFMMGIVWMAAKKVGVKIRLGMDWNRNLDPRDETFLDLPHVELDEP